MESTWLVFARGAGGRASEAGFRASAGFLVSESAQGDMSTCRAHKRHMCTGIQTYTDRETETETDRDTH